MVILSISASLFKPIAQGHLYEKNRHLPVAESGFCSIGFAHRMQHDARNWTGRPARGFGGRKRSQKIMKKFTVHQGLVAPMDRENVDTDAIIPKQFLKSIRKTGFGPHLFDEWRYLDAGFPGQDPAARKPNPDFVLNQPRYAGASILLARKNFGCGSSREHAPWALDQYGFRAIIAPSYADIFFNNSFKNGLLPIVLPESQVDQLFDDALAFPGYLLTIDLERQVIIQPQGEELPFDVQAFRKYCLINGLDDIGLTLRNSDKIKAFEAERLARKPWLNHVAGPAA
jgi:3-isopropylmalate/(R)-2-methylmalate dehydratase small subunit